MSGQGLVKKLLFPAYTDAGANDTFASSREIDGRSDGGSSEQRDDGSNMGLSDKLVGCKSENLNDDLLSDATTAIHDNRSSSRMNKHTNSTRNSEESIEGKDLPNEGDESKASNFFPSTAPRQLAATDRNLSTTTSMGSSVEHSYFGHMGEETISTQLQALRPPSQDSSEDVDESRSDVVSEVLSTASEMGTVIGVDISARMAELNSMVSDAIREEESDQEEDDEIIANGLSLPLLDEHVGRDTSIIDEEGESDDNRDSPGSINMQTAATAMVSAAFRRIGNGVGVLGRSGAFSAPSTPRQAPPKVEDYLKSAYRSSDNETPPSFLLRSPGSAAHHRLSANKLKRPMLSPRFAEVRDRPGNDPSDNVVLRHANSLASPLRFARGCFSFDNTQDGENFVYSPPQPKIPESISRSRDRPLQPRDSHLRTLIHSKSWDAGSGTISINKQNYSSAFRSVPSDSRVLHGDAKHYSKHDGRKLTKDFSPSIVTTKNAIALRTPQRVEIEREDAIDILRCLVERSMAYESETVNFENESHHDIGNSTENTEQAIASASDDDRVSTFAEVGSRGGHSVIQSPPKKRRSKLNALRELDAESLSSDVAVVVNDLREMSKMHGTENDHENRMRVMDEFIRSYIYSAEIRRAARSASTWLNSVSNSGANFDDVMDIDLDRSTHESSSGFIARDHGGAPLGPVGQSFDESIDALTTRAMLRSAQVRAKDKEDEARRLNTELSECRAEIGRLKSALQAGQSFTSPRQSILDRDDDDDSETSEAQTDEEKKASDDKSDFARQSTRSQTSLFKEALVEANNVIRELHAEAQKKTSSSREIVETNSTSFPLAQLADESDQLQAANGDSQEIATYSKSSSLSGNDSDNVVSGWEKETRLPPPPDHELQSPIVTALLSEWTTDPAMHRSLLSWVEGVLKGADPTTVPPLVISSLDSELRDGLIVHVLALLSKRPDVEIDVRSRWQRRTTYDLAVRVRSKVVVEDKMGSPLGFSSGMTIEKDESDVQRDSSEVGASSVAHSAVTAQMANTSTRMISRAFEAGSSPVVENSPSFHNDESRGLMGAINSTFGGLLSRGRKIPPQQPYTEGVDGVITDIPLTADGHRRDEPEPYQRVLSCPPGRIGLTFVQYRGHAMVSDVASESPLSGWVFSGDILIAIDEVPVSGMRVRDIVKLLTARKDRQRALRVISSHAMNEFTLNTSLMSEPGL